MKSGASSGTRERRPKRSSTATSSSMRPFTDDCDLPDSYFDVVTMNDVLEHFPFSEPALMTVKRILEALLAS